MQSNEAKVRALVLGGGGVAGVAWELGIIVGLRDAGVDVTNTDLFIGTSAGSVVGAQITSGTDIESLFNAQLIPAEQSKERMVQFDGDQLLEAFSEAVGGGSTNPKAIRARIGAYALAAPTISEAERREIIESRLPVKEWPQQHLLIVAVDAGSGEEYIMDRDSGVSLIDAVAASCAVPGTWPPVTIAGHRYMDGGIRSSTNADLAKGYERILILNPIGEIANFLGSGLNAEVTSLREGGSQVLVIGPDEASIAAIGANPLDPTTREPSARAGRALGREMATEVGKLWTCQ